jgi:uncharacterized protein YcfJ
MRSIFLVLLSIFSGSVFASSVSFTLEGQVIRIEPKYRVSTTYEKECWTDQVPTQQMSSDHSYGGAVLGGLTGGVVGNKFGKGKGKEAATALGAVIGAFAGDNISNDGYRRSAPSSVQYRSEQRCRSVPRTQEVPDGYDVAVRFQGRDVVLQMRDDPGYGSIRLDFNGTIMPANRW